LVGRSCFKEQHGRLKTDVAFENYNTGEVHESMKMQDGLGTKSKNGFCK
jgi:hypothetical protein